MSEEVKIMQSMVKQGVKSKVEVMRLQREQSKILKELHSAKNSIPKIHSLIRESEQKIKQVNIEFQNRAKIELNEASVNF